ncbi:unnamed protein product [Prunus armeniaca]|uniref:Uncharacterized protein n=1 Tax=Prunus armeniaca TaxID=36596 RepID=A0A6J5TH57_PRUAR|nr:unnamed protein product [Prunus armeniaca]CAB4294008.1 unnamed protein product [Prunus armeniaca]
MTRANVVGNRWRDWKCRLKHKWYDKYDTDERHLAIIPPRVVTEQWKTPVKYWGLPKMKEKGEKTDRLSMFTRTKKKKNDENEVFDEDNANIINQFNQCLEEREEDEQDESFRVEIFTKVMGTNAHGHVSMYGADDLQSKLNEVSSQLSQVMTHVGFQTTPEESGSCQCPFGITYLGDK